MATPSRVIEDRVVAIPGWTLEGQIADPAMRNSISGVVAVNAAGVVIGQGEFGFLRHTRGWRRVDALADGFDLYFRANADCALIRVYGLNDGASRFMLVSQFRHCAESLPT